MGHARGLLGRGTFFPFLHCVVILMDLCRPQTAKERVGGGGGYTRGKSIFFLSFSF